MPFLSLQRFTDTDLHFEELCFHGGSFGEADTQMRQWIMHTMPLGTCIVDIQTTYSTDGTQHVIFLNYTCRQKAEDRVEPKGIFGSVQTGVD